MAQGNGKKRSSPSDQDSSSKRPKSQAGAQTNKKGVAGSSTVKPRQQDRSAKPSTSGTAPKQKFRDQRRPQQDKPGRYQTPKVPSGKPVVDDGVARASLGPGDSLVSKATSWVDTAAAEVVRMFLNTHSTLQRHDASLQRLNASTFEKPFPALNMVIPKDLKEIVGGEELLKPIFSQLHEKLKEMAVASRVKSIETLNERTSVSYNMGKFDDKVKVHLTKIYPNPLDQDLKEAKALVEEKISEVRTGLLANLTELYYQQSTLRSEKVIDLITPVNVLNISSEGEERSRDGPQSIRLTNLTNIVLPNTIVKILNKGYKYILHESYDLERVLENFDQTIAKVKQGLPSTVPKATLDASIYMRRIELIDNQPSFNPLVHERNLIRAFIAKNRLKLCVADKNLGIVLMDISDYLNEVNKHLTDTSTYSVVQFSAAEYKDKDIFSNFMENTVLLSLLELVKTLPEPFLRPLSVKMGALGYEPDMQFSIPEFQVLPKIHKTPMKTRPIVSNINTVCTPLSKWLDNKLKPLLANYPWISNGTLDTIYHLETIQVLMDDPLPTSGDIVSLYTSIDNNKALLLLGRALKRAKYQPHLIAKILSLMSWLLKNCFFTSQGLLYRQISGLPMGTNVAPTLCNIILGEIELEYSSIYGSLPLGYTRFIDDTFMILKRSLKLRFIKDFTFLFKGNLGLDWTWVHGDRIPFLDLEISLGKRFKRSNHVDYSLFEKETNMHLYTHPSSNYPDKYKFSWIYGECVRILRNSSDEASFRLKLSEFKTHLKRNEYPMSIIQRYTSISYSNRLQHLLLKVKEFDHGRKHIGISHGHSGQLIKEKVDTILQDIRVNNKFHTVLFKGKNLLTSVPANVNRLIDLFLKS